MAAVRFRVALEDAVGVIEWGRTWGVACTRIHRSADDWITIHAESPREGLALAFARQLEVPEKLITRVSQQAQELSQ